MTLKQRMLEALKAKKPDAFAKINPDTITEEALEQAYREAFEAAPAAAPPVAAPPALVPAAQGLVTMEHLRMLEARQNARDIIGTSRLPDAAKARLAADFAAKERFTEADVTAAIKAEATYLAQFSEAGKVVIGSDGEVQVEDRAVRMAGMFDAFFDPTHKDHRNVRSFRECYVEVTGDKHVTGRLEDCDRVRMAESLGVFRESLTTASWANVLGNSITRRMIADYRGTSEYDVWRPLVGTPVPIQDFRSNERTRYGGYGDLPAVAQGGAYAALTSPGDEKSTYAIAKKGGTEDLTLEMVANDDVGAIRQLPIRLSRAAKRTLGKFVLDFYATNPAIYDGVAWFHASHGNLATAALDATSLAARRLAMLKQAELGSADRLGIGPKYLIVPPDLVETATNLFNRTTNHDETFVQKMRLEIIPVWYWTDVNDWALQADPMNAPSFELGFYQGNEEPELFVQDMPNVGSLFSNDKVTWKIRHIYGGAVVDYRTADKSVVA